MIIQPDKSHRGRITPTSILVFIGDLRIDVGSIKGKDEMLSYLTTQNSSIRDVEMAYRLDNTRGPPPIPRTVFVVGSVQHVYLGDAEDESYPKRGLFDLDLRSGREAALEFNREFQAWIDTGGSLDSPDIVIKPKRNPGDPIIIGDQETEAPEPHVEPHLAIP